MITQRWLDMRKLSAVDFYQDHHKVMAGLFRQFESEPIRMPDAPEVKAGVVNEIYLEIEIHARIDREILHPVLEQIAGKDVRLQSRDALDDVEKAITSLKKMNPQNMDFDEPFDGMIEDFEFHLLQELSELRDLSHASPQHFLTLGEKMQDLREKVLALKKTHDRRQAA